MAWDIIDERADLIVARTALVDKYKEITRLRSDRDAANDAVWEATCALGERGEEIKRLTEELRRMRAYKNPDFLQKMVLFHGVDDRGSAFGRSVFDPRGFPKEDYYQECAPPDLVFTDPFQCSHPCPASPEEDYYQECAPRDSACIRHDVAYNCSALSCVPSPWLVPAASGDFLMEAG